MLEDRYGLPLTTPSTAARDAYVAGVDSVLSAVAGYRDDLTSAIASDPSFALAHLAMARGLAMDGAAAEARQSARKAEELAPSASPREQSQVNAIRLGLTGRPVEAMQATLTHLKAWPRDAMVLAPAAGVFGLFGFSGRSDHEEQLYQLLTSLAPSYGEDWWFDGAFGFAACETGRLAEAERLVDRSLARNPRNANGAHFRAHVLYERGETQAAFDFLESWLPALDRRSLMHCHLSWHLALAALALDRRDRAWEAYREAVHPGGAWGPPLNVVTDSTSFLWRAEMAGEARDVPLWQQAHGHALQQFPAAGVAYADVHTLLACVIQDDASNLTRLLGEIRQRIQDQRYPPGDVVVRLMESLAACADGRWDDAIDRLEQALPDTVRIGGSRAQRDLVGLTLDAAYVKAGRRARAVGLRRPQTISEVGPRSQSVH